MKNPDSSSPVPTKNSPENSKPNRPRLTIGAADFNEQGKLGELLITELGAAWDREAVASKKGGQYGVPAADELMAADDFYFSNAELMNCCLFARVGGKIIGTACVNPSTSTLHFLLVKAEFRHQNVGRQLLAAAETVAKRYHQRALKLDFPMTPEFADAGKFLEKCGYMAISSRITYSKPLTT